jgi:NTP pyrophosphatase (non-canonical NTP hydrolase)
MVGRIYWRRDSRRSVEQNYIHLVEEVGELGSAIVRGDRASIEEELADTLAWLVTVAAVLKVDLGKVATRRYNNACPKCRSLPCKCPGL